MEKILIVCGCYPNHIKEQLIQNSKGLSQIAADELQNNVIKGVFALTKEKVDVITTPFVGYFPFHYKKLFIKDAKMEDEIAKYNVLGWLNIKGLETIIKSQRIYHAAKKWCEASPNNRHIFVYSHYAGFMRAMGKLKRKFPNVIISCMVTDMPEIEYSHKNLLQKIRKLPSKIMFNTIYKNIKYINYFNVLSKHMVHQLGVKENQCCVIECMCSNSEVDNKTSNNTKREDNLCCFAYTGTLHRRYGIVNLLEAFKKTQNKDFRLWICGYGDAKDEVIKAAKEDSRIVYHGVLSHDKTVSLQAMADILVNPRTPEGEFTKYSFPSKTIEYMCAGKPVLAFKLAGIPDEYDNYLLYFDDILPEEMSKKLLNVGKKSQNELEEIGQKNKEFAVLKKNYLVQTKKILDFMGLKYE